MTQGQSAPGKTNETKPLEQIVKEACRHSDERGNPRPDAITYTGLSKYLNLEQGRAIHWTPDSAEARVARYRAIETLSGELGMSEGHRLKVLDEGYKTLNGTRRTKPLEEAGISKPAPARSIDAAQASSSAPAASSSAPRAPEHDAQTLASLDALLKEPHSFLSLSGHKREHLLALEGKDLRQVVNADEKFVKESAAFWNLDPTLRADTAQHVAGRFNLELCQQAGAAFATNANPTAAFVAGKGAAVNAVALGYNIYGVDAADNKAALKLLGEATVAINLAVSPQTTLAGRGVDSISEQTMGFSPDGHSNAPTRRH
ncbi:hypothetical protein [Lysobacter silvisoli]|uniref:hypothetical protein n=1 Tax=Lysobacter silvisoli TaxID=2293254 RepID=UPI001E395192|nr:hypothetical protein [Lysobacter silvisoli]